MESSRIMKEEMKMSKIKNEINMNYENMMKVDEKYQDLVTDIVCYIRVELNYKDAEEAINDINDILLSAQDRGEDLYEVIGDYQVFCKDIISSYKEGVKGYGSKRLKMYLAIGVWVLALIIAQDIVFKFPYSEINSWEKIASTKYSLTLGPIMTAIISCAISMGLLKFILKRPSKSSKKKRDFLIFSLVGMVIIAILVLVTIVTRNIEIITFERFGIGFILAFIIAIFGIGYMIYFPIKVTRK